MLVAIDPGFTGAISLLDGEHLAEVESLPLNLDDSQKRVDGLRIRQILAEWDMPNQSHYHAVIERVSARPGQGVTSTFNFGLSYGVLVGVLESLGFDVQFVRPQDWKKHFGLSSNKTAARELASELWPDWAHAFARVKDDGRAEAALIGLYVERVRNEKDS